MNAASVYKGSTRSDSTMVKKSPSAFFEEGITLFNDGRFFECHEAWEEIWKRSSGDEKLFYQGIIQAAVAILHAQRGNLIGAASLYAKASAKLDHLPAEHMGIALGQLRDALKDFIVKATRGETLPNPPKLRRLGQRLD